MQVGEPAAPAKGGGATARKEWVGEVVEITFKTNIVSARDRTEIKPPHWKAGEDPTDDWPLAADLKLGKGPFSKKAATYLVKGTGSPEDVEVKVRVTKCVDVSGTGKLKGVIGSIEIEGSCPLALGEHTVSAKIKELPEAIEYFHGLVNWRMEEVEGSTVAMNGTLVELFFVLAKPQAFYVPGVWVEALRLVCLRGPVTGIQHSEEVRAVGNITRYCHSNHGVRYDTMGGRPFYGAGRWGGTYLLWNYLQKTSVVVNCYDQAGAVQALSGCIGIDATWIFMNPYGFIQTTDLVGVGLCNNPFYPLKGSTPLTAQNDPKRTPFGNHAFVEHGGAIFDACAGPHVGTEDRDGYVAGAIDSTTTLYGVKPYLGRLQAGTTSDMLACSGVASIV